MRAVFGRRLFLALLGAVLCTAAVASTDGLTRIVVAYPAGSTMDNVARMLTSAVQEQQGGQFVVENKPGAAGTIGAEYAARAAPDGRTLFIAGSSTHSANPALIRGLRYDPVKDFVPVVEIATLSYALVVNASTPVDSMAALVQASKAAPKGLSYAHGSQLALVAASAISKLAGMRTVGVPYKGQPQALSDLLGGHVDFTIADIPVLLPHIRAGKLRPLAVLNPSRSPLLPEVKTLQEQGLTGYDLLGWIGIVAPAGTPPEIVRALSKSFGDVLGAPAFREKLSSMGMEHRPNSPAEFGRTVSEQVSVWSRRVRDAGLQPE